MKLEEATAVLRPRGSWEAVDLGCALARRHWGRLVRGWLTVALPLWGLICLVLHDYPAWALFLLTWTKPILTRQPVFFTSRALFGQPPSPGEFWRQWRTSFRGIIGSLTFRRFSFQRPFRLPVIMLEGQRGAAYSQRAAVLSGHGGGTASGLTLIASLLEFAVLIAMAFIIFSVVNMFNPTWLEVMDFFKHGEWNVPDSLLWALTGAWAASVIVVEPFYAAAGFALYINSRTHLEGWDIEVAFRRMSARLAPLAAAAACLLFILLPAAQSRAASDEPDPKAVAQEVLKGPDFELEQIERKVYKQKTEHNRPDKNFDPGFSGAPIGAGLSGLGYAIIAALVVGVIFLLMKYRGSVSRGRGDDEEKRIGPRVVMGMDLSPESLPPDIPQAAWLEYMAGRPLEALRLLYRGSLAWLVNRAGLPVHESDTEGDCLRHSQQIPDTARVSFFTNLTAAWVNCAYADMPPAADPMKALCDRWPFSLRQPAEPKATPPAGAASAWLLLPLAAVSLLFSACDNPNDYDIVKEPGGYKGAARVNPWLAAERMLTKTGTPSETRVALGDLPAWNATIFLPLDSITSRGEARNILRWASNGGHLIVACSGTGRFHNDFDGVESEHMDKESPLLEELHIKESETDATGTFNVKFEDQAYTLQSYDTGALDIGWISPDVLAGNRNSATVASFEHDMGRITLLGGATPFRNRYLAENDHAAILYNLVALHPSNLVIFVSKSEVTLWDMIRRYAWMPFTAGLLLIILWLWRHLPRFGRAVPADESGVRHFGTQLDEAGRFLSERAGSAALLAPARRAVLTAASQRGLQADAPDFMEQLSARSGLTHSEVSAALLDSTGKNLTATTAALQKLLQSIGTPH